MQFPVKIAVEILKNGKMLQTEKFQNRNVSFRPWGGTVGQEAVKLICQSEWKTQRNAKVSFWPLFSTEMDLILM